REASAGKDLGQLATPGQQRGGGVVVPLGLDQAFAIERAALADRAIDRTYQALRRERSRTVAQGTGEELVEGRIAVDVRLCRLLHVDAVATHEPVDHGRRGPPAAQTGQTAGEDG